MLPYSCLRGKSFFQVSRSKQTILVQSTLGRFWCIKKLNCIALVSVNRVFRKEQQIDKTSAFIVSDVLMVNYLSIFKYKHLVDTHTPNFYRSSNGGTA